MIPNWQDRKKARDGKEDRSNMLGRNSLTSPTSTAEIGNSGNDLSKSISEVERVIRLALSRNCYANIESPWLADLIDLRDSFLLNAISLCVQALPKVIIDSPLATGLDADLHSNYARSIFEVHATDTGMMHFAELLGYYPVLVPDRGTPWGKSARDCFPHWQWHAGPYDKFHSNGASVLRVTPAAIVLQQVANELVWSNNSGYRGKLEDVVSAILSFTHRIVPGNVLLICRFGESEEEWLEKLDVYAVCAKECGLRFHGCSLNVRLELPNPAFLRQDVSSGHTRPWDEFPLNWTESLPLPTFSLDELSREIWDQSCVSGKRLKKPSTPSKKPSRIPSTSASAHKPSGD